MLAVLVLLVIGYVLLVLPGGSYVTMFLNDVIGLTDGAYRVYHGRVPSLNFGSLYGAATWYPSALGFYLGYEPGAVLAFGHFLTAAVLLPIAAIVGHRRLPLAATLVLLVFLFLLIIVPVLSLIHI